MSAPNSDPKGAPAGGLQSMLARLRGMVNAVKAPPEKEPENDELLPTFDGPAVPPPLPGAVPAGMPLAVPVDVPEEVPLALPVEAPEAVPVEPEGEPEPPKPKKPLLCPLCKAPREADHTYCSDCGFIFPAVAAAADDPEEPAAPPPPAPRLNGRYQLGEMLTERGGVSRFRGLDHGDDGGEPRPVVILRAAAPPTALPAAEAVPVEEAETLDDVLPTFDLGTPTALPITDTEPGATAWPSLAWERDLLRRAGHPSLPAVVDDFIEDGFEYLVEEVPAGPSLWDAWDAPEATAEERFYYLKQIAEALHTLHQHGALLEGIRPDIIVVTRSGQARLTDLADLLPLPLPPDPPLRASLYTAPELAALNPQADARADLYSFGAMLYALHAGRELAEMDFERPGYPKPFLPYFPDVHPLFGRLMMKTFCRDPNGRFPTDEAAREDPTGFSELIRVLDVCRRTLDHVRLEIACWTTTGVVRTGNEDAFALLHAAESRQDDLSETALVLLCDGMGGYEAGEVAAALAIQALRKNLLQQKPFAQLAGGSPFPADGQKADAGVLAALDVAGCKKLILAALKEANKLVHTASRSGTGRRGMGCTAEVVYVDGRKVVVGHVGDSRTYHLHEGRLIQLTRDQTLVNRLVELGTLSPEEAEDHPRKNELQQAIGGQPDVEPGLYHGVMKPGDWVVVCSDGVSNHVKPHELKQMLQSEATSAEMAARRLVNLVNIEGATDNATVVVVRAT